MNTTRLAGLVALSLLVAGSAAAGTLSSLDEAVAAAEYQKKPVLLEFFTDW